MARSSNRSDASSPSRPRKKARRSRHQSTSSSSTHVGNTVLNVVTMVHGDGSAHSMTHGHTGPSVLDGTDGAAGLFAEECLLENVAGCVLPGLAELPQTVYHSNSLAMGGLHGPLYFRRDEPTLCAGAVSAGDTHLCRQEGVANALASINRLFPVLPVKGVAAEEPVALEYA